MTRTTQLPDEPADEPAGDAASDDDPIDTGALQRLLGSEPLAPAVPNELPPLGRLAPGDRLADRFIILRELGRGANGYVYAATDQTLERNVAIKTLRVRAEGHALARFRREAQIAAGIDHPSIVKVWDVVVPANPSTTPALLVMEIVEGTTLRRRIERTPPLLVEETLSIVIGLLAGLAQMHDQGLAHCDLKPENVSVTSRGSVRILDFGLARLNEADAAGAGPSGPPSDVASRIGGTPAYAAPEVWRAEHPTAAADVWAVGVILWEALHGTHPYWQHGAGRDDNLARMGQGPAAWFHRTRSWSPRLDEAIEAMLAADPRDRIAHARLALNALEPLRDQAQRRAAIDRGRNPFVGLRSFNGDSAAYFFGREDEQRALLDHVARSALTAVVGSSAVGKSSLVRAGLLPTLAAAGDWSILTMTPGAHPMAALASCLAPLVTDVSPAQLGARLLAFARAQRQRVLLFVDQLEQLYTLSVDAGERSEFLLCLAALVIDASAPLRLVITVRSDTLEVMADEARGLFGEVLRSHFAMGPMQPASLKRALDGPAEAAGFSFAPGLADHIVEDLGDSAAPLLHLQFVGEQLWMLRDLVRGEIPFDAYQGIGGVAGALVAHADRVLRDLGDERRNIARRVLLSVCTVDGDSAPRGRDELIDVREVVDALLGAGLLSEVTTGSGDLVQLAHEALVREWPTLRDWLKEDATRVSLGYRLVLAIRRNRAIAITVFVAVVVVAAGATSFLLRERGLRLDAERAQVEAERARELADRRTGEISLEQARQAIVEDRRPLAALRHLVEAHIRGVDNSVIRTLTAQAIHNLWLFELPAVGDALDVDYSPDGHQIVTADEKAARIWDAQTGALLHVLPHEQTVWTAVFSRDGRRVVTASRDGTAQVWDVATGARVGAALQHRGNANDVTLSPDGTRVASVGEDGIARVWAATTGAPLTPWLAHGGPGMAVGFDPAGTRIIVASRDGTARIWESSNGTQIAVLHHRGPVRSAIFSPDGTRALTASEDHAGRLWDLATGTAIELPHADEVRRAVWSPDGRRMLTGCMDGTAQLWDASDGSALGAPLIHGASVRTVAFSPDGTVVATGGDDHMIRLWDVETGLLLGAPLAHEGIVWDIAFSPDGTQVAGANATTRVWDARPARPDQMIHGGPALTAASSDDGSTIVTTGLDGSAAVFDVAGGGVRWLDHGAPIWAAAIGGGRVVTGGDDGLARRWDAATGASLEPPMVHGASIRTVATTVDGTRALTSGDDGVVRLWDAATGAPIAVLHGHTGQVRQLEVAPDGRLAATAGDDGTARIWNLTTGMEVVALPHERAVRAARWSPDGTRLATVALDWRVRIWEVANGRLQVTLSNENNHIIGAIGWRADGRRILGAMGWSSVVWDAQSGLVVVPPVVHEGDVQLATFSPDGATAVTTDDTGVAIVWDAASGEPIGAPLRHDDAVTSVAFTRDGSHLVTTSRDGVARVWPIAFAASADEPWRVLEAAGARAEKPGWPTPSDHSGWLIRSVIARARPPVRTSAPPAALRPGACTRRPSGTHANLRGVTWSTDHRMAVAVGDRGTILWSRDTISWHRAVGLAPDESYAAVTFGDGRFVAAGATKNTRHDRVIAISDDGVAWRTRRSPEAAALTHLAFGHHVFVAAGLEGAIARSTDGWNWEEISSGATYHFKGLAFIAGRFLLTEGTRLVRTSPDGRTWEPVDGVPLATIHLATTRQGAPVVSGVTAPYRGAQPTVMWSSDLVNWSHRTVPNARDFETTMFTGDAFVALSSGLEVSRDGETWQTLLPNTLLGSGDLTSTGSHLLVVGRRGALYTCELSPPAR